MKTPKELNTLKNEVEELNRKLRQLNEEELVQVFGGLDIDIHPISKNDIDRGGLSLGIGSGDGAGGAGGAGGGSGAAMSN